MRWGWRDRGPRRTTAFEIDGVSEQLLAEFSTRSRDIDAATQSAITIFAHRHGRRPGRSETIRLRQHATRATRPTKTVLSLAELVDAWRTRAHQLTRTNPRTLVAHLGRRTAPIDLHALLEGDDATRILAGLADDVIAATMTRRSTWTRWNLVAEAARATRALRLPTARERLELVDGVVEQAMTRCVSLATPDLFTVPEDS